MNTPAFCAGIPSRGIIRGNVRQNLCMVTGEALSQTGRRGLLYGAGGAFNGLKTRRDQLVELVKKGGGRFGGKGGHGGTGDGGDDWDDDGVDPSWGIAPVVHVLMRGRCDEAYRLMVANLVAMGRRLEKGVGADVNVPVVVILSWMGAQQKNLRRYTKIYEDLGYEVVCVLNDVKTAMWPSSSKEQAMKIGSFLEGQPEDRPVLIHAFSIGTGIYGLLLDSIRNEQEKFDRFRKQVVGVVFDSGPAPIFPDDVATAMHMVCPMFPKNVWQKVTQMFFWVSRARQSYGKSEDALRKSQFKAPQLYFYSQDEVIPGMVTAVEEFMEKNKQRGVEVYKKFWDKSAHAMHLKLHPEEYAQNLNAFVTRCMELRKQQNNSTTSTK